MTLQPTSIQDASYAGARKTDKTILIAEDHAIVRGSLHQLISDIVSSQAQSVTILETSTLEETRVQIDLHRDCIDLVLLDLDLQDCTSAETLDCLRREWRTLPVVVISASEDWKQVVDLIKLGVAGFIPKRASISLMASALKLIFSGGRYFPDEAIQNLYVLSPKPPQPIQQTSHEDQLAHRFGQRLSARQIQVLSLVHEGLSNKEIARKLGLSPGTAKNYIATIMRVFNISNRTKLVKATMNSSQEESLPDSVDKKKDDFSA